MITPSRCAPARSWRVSDLLATTPGVTVTRNGGLGSTTSLRIRGAESEQTLVLIDGVKLNDPSSAGGGFNFADLLMGDFARIEVLRGPQSALWGSQAIGGVVNIVTPVPDGPLTAASSAEGGSFGTAGASAHAQAATNASPGASRGNYLTTDGISAFDEDLRRTRGRRLSQRRRQRAGIVVHQRCRYGRSALVLVGGPLGLSTAFRRRTSRSPTPANTASPESGSAYAGINIDTLGGKLKNRLGVAHTDIDRENRDPDSLSADARSTPTAATGWNIRARCRSTMR